ncbi:DNA damage-inducible protein D [Lactococcus lactis]|uniref:DNA damage-inducible protein D n=1 Tax=Lactococcus lactis TaxID=1358 RepID=UPI002418A010|nr:DNA damage-inducible protein D [Lactococcus lactis]MDG4966119.1 DNA damage-inducible protein D [Lactococcus lactis]
MELTNYDELTFENIKQIDENGQEFWYARDLQTVLEYTEWRNFIEVIDKAKTASQNAGNLVISNFVDVNKNVKIGFGYREIDDIKLSRYACYLIVQNGDPRKEVIALGQSYFAIKTRQQEVQDEFNKLSEDDKRISIRDEVKRHNKSLSESAGNAGVTNFGEFHNYGYRGLYNGLTMADIHERKGLDNKEHILDNMGSAELAANLFRATQTDEKLRREQIKGAQNANDTHYEVGKKVRKTMADLGNAMPEDLPTPLESLKDIKQKAKKKIKPVEDIKPISLFDDFE